MVFAVIFYVFTTYTITIGYGVKRGEVRQEPGGPEDNGLTVVASGFGTLVEIGAMLSAFIVCVGLRDRGARTCSRWAARASCPKARGRMPRYKTPVNATLRHRARHGAGAA